MNFLFNLSGRIGRQKYWIRTLIAWGIFLAAGVISGAVNPDPDSFTKIDRWILSPAVLVGVWIAFSANVKRLHDRGKSGLWLLISLIPFVGELWLFIELGFLEGDRLHNLYGGPDSA